MNATPLGSLVVSFRSTAALLALGCLPAVPGSAQVVALTAFPPLEAGEVGVGGADVRLRLSEPAVTDRPEESAAPRLASAPRLKKTARSENAAVPLAFCFGPLFGNSAREVNPNYMPEPVASGGAGVKAALAARRAHYTRVAPGESGMTTWVGNDGSRIAYLSPNSRGADQGWVEVEERERAPRSVGEVIAENRRAMTEISWGRVLRRFPELARLASAERTEFELYLRTKRADPATAPVFESLLWPETLAVAFMAERDWKRVEAESWERVRERARDFEDPESAGARRFFEFTEGLRVDPGSAVIFEEPTWPEKVWELHDRRIREGGDDAR